uniref:G protein-coupled receptor 107 n=1 Tax=Gopherus evgoodei TaxID=1825980 RepID=A0A8C5F3A9_9SAUR
MLLVELIQIFLKCSGNLHDHRYQDDVRQKVHLSTFGVFMNGFMMVNVSNLSLKGHGNDNDFLINDGHSTWLDEEVSYCILKKKPEQYVSVILLHLDFTNNILGDLTTLAMWAIQCLSPQTEEFKSNSTRKPSACGMHFFLIIIITLLPQNVMEQVHHFRKDKGTVSFEVRFLSVALLKGLYRLCFPKCVGSVVQTSAQLLFSLDIEIKEKNPESYLLAGEIPLPKLYISMHSLLFFLSATIVYRNDVFKIHWLMAAFPFTKSLSLTFCSLSCSLLGSVHHCYICSFFRLKDFLLFITIILISTGWVLASVAYVIIESREEATTAHGLWKRILFLVDLLCYNVVILTLALVPSLPSIDCMLHLHHTRVIPIVIRFAVLFQWNCLYQLLDEMATFMFFVFTGYKFCLASELYFLLKHFFFLSSRVATSGVMKSREKVKKAVNGSAEPRHKWKNAAQGADSSGPRQHFPRKCYCTTTPWKGSNLSFPTLRLQTGVCEGEQNIAKS